MFDLDSYFDRVAYRGPRAPTLAVLRALCAAQPAAIPFENIDPLLGRPPELAPAALAAKLVASGRGGYCYELNALLRLALLEIGFEVTSLAARVTWMSPPEAPPRARSHMLLQVGGVRDAGSQVFLADAGFGGHLLAAPLVFDPDRAQPTPGGVERLVRDGTGWSLQAQLGAGWTPVYRFELEAQRPVDYEPLNWYTATHPQSIFRHNLLAERLTPRGRASLLNDRLTWRPTDGAVEVLRLHDATEFERTLEEVFGITLAIPARDLFEHVPKGLDALHAPAAP